MNEITLAYLAGVLDSDGTIGIKRNTYAVRVIRDSEQPTYSERIHIRQVEPHALNLFSDTFGGRLGITKPSAAHARPLYYWGQTDRKAANTLLALLPYLRIKKAQAENCLALRVVKEQSKIARMARGRGHVGSAPRPINLSEAMEAHFMHAKFLNRVGIREEVMLGG